MPSFLYFGYGSNMLTERLRARCPSTKVVAKGYAEGHTLAFSKPSKDGSGKGHLVHTPKRRQLGVLFEIDVDELGLLDDAEGLNKGYSRDDAFLVRRADTGDVVTTTVYLATKPNPALIPYDWYLALIVAGAREHRFDRRRIRKLLAVQSRAQGAPPWTGRDEATRLLKAAGVNENFGEYLADQLLAAQPLPKRKGNIKK